MIYFFRQANFLISTLKSPFPILSHQYDLASALLQSRPSLFSPHFIFQITIGHTPLKAPTLSYLPKLF